MALMSLGTFVFGLPTLLFDQLSRRMVWKHVAAPRVGAMDALQYLGIGPETISLEGLAVAELQDAEAAFATLVDMANTGGVYPLVDGAGHILGAYVITGLDRRSRTFLDNGVPVVTDFGLDLLRHPDPDGMR